MNTTSQNTFSNIGRIFVATVLFGCLSFSFNFLAGVQQEKKQAVSDKKQSKVSAESKPFVFVRKDEVVKEDQIPVNYQSKKSKIEIENLKNEVANLKAQHEYLKEENSFLRKERDSVLSVIENSNEYYGILKNTIKKGSQVWISDVKLNFLKELSNGKFKPTHRAKSTDVIQVGFTVNGSKISLATDKTYYIQIVDDNNNIVGKKDRKDFGNMTLEYSDLLTVMYFDKNIEAKADIQTYELKKGIYSVFIFDDRELVTKSSFELE
ncbi:MULTISPECIES: hypothetical protein [Flavobacterium]|uniref:Chromosome partitioning protein ParA n=1 Tax=Flavobacterium hankyongi TaxID=1176532 RepID=A0ABP8ZIM8_9FLAO|nr:hypothetical protein [Flavobacterium sp. N1846]